MRSSLAILIFAGSFFTAAAFADSAGQAIADKTTLATLKMGLERDLDVTNVEITSYAKAWTEYNPMKYLMDPHRAYRMIAFSFDDANGKKQTLKCKLNIISGEDRVTIHSCTGGDKEIGLYMKLANYGYYGTSINIEDVITTDPNFGLPVDAVQ